MKIGFLITARLKSKRLPLKLLLDLGGKTVIERVIDRAKSVKGITDIILCTSTNPQDKPLADIAKENSIYYFNGDEEDVVKRLLNAARFHNLDYFLSVTADNPLFSIYHASLIVDELKKSKRDFIKLTGLPMFQSYGVSTRALAVICKIKKIIDTEIWGYLINRPEIFDVYTIKATGKLNRPEIRLTLDYEEDYKLINNIYSNVLFNEVVNLVNAIEYLDEHPKLARINRKCIQLDLNNKVKKEIERLYKDNLEKIRKIKEEIYEERI